MSEFEKVFQGKVRVRVCGLLLENEKLLLLRHKGIGTHGYLWSPPGGGLDFSEKAESALMREFKEETGLTVDIQEFLFVNEYISGSLHAMELFFSVKKVAGYPALGRDPELPEREQILEALYYFSEEELKNLEPQYLHNSFRFCGRPFDIFKLKGFFNFTNISK